MIYKPKPLKENKFVENEKVLVSKVYVQNGLKQSIEKAVSLIGGFKKIIKAGETVSLVPNFNSDDPFPASTDLNFLQAVVDLLNDYNAKCEILVSSGIAWLPTKNVIKNLGVDRFCKKNGIKLKILEEGKSIKVKLPGYWKSVKIFKNAYDAEKLIYLPCLKVHRWARFSLSLKLAVTFLSISDRYILHTFGKLEERIADLNQIVHPDLVIIDGRKAFITKGPDIGEIVNPGVILASGDRVAIDIEGLKILKNYKKYRSLNRLNMPILKMPQIARALQLKLGSQHYVLKTSKK
ncbi:MAG: DUF362 domain-containing protein [Candidatus Pacearchaeota archaeon]